MFEKKKKKKKKKKKGREKIMVLFVARPISEKL